MLPANATVLVEGSTTYEWIPAEEDILDHPEKWRGFHGDRPTFVFTTRSLTTPEGADVRFVSGPVAVALPAIQAAGDGDVWVVGSGDLAGQFLDAGALDEIALSVAPVFLTGGAPHPPPPHPTNPQPQQTAQSPRQIARLV